MQQAKKTSPLFAAQLTPHRAMSPKTVRWVIAFTAVLASIPGILFYALGAWPVVGFMGLDVALLWWAMTKNLKEGEAFEEITLWPDELHIRQVSATGEEQIKAFNPFWVKFSTRLDHANEIVTGLHISHRGEKMEIGAFLNPDDKKSFSQVFGNALAKANR